MHKIVPLLYSSTFSSSTSLYITLHLSTTSSSLTFFSLQHFPPQPPPWWIVVRSAIWIPILAVAQLWWLDYKDTTILRRIFNYKFQLATPPIDSDNFNWHSQIINHKIFESNRDRSPDYWFQLFLSGWGWPQVQKAEKTWKQKTLH